LETIVSPRHRNDVGALSVALAQLAEQDPLIDVRQDDVRQEISVSLYGEVQKEVIGATWPRTSHRRQLPRDDDDLHRTAHRLGRGSGATARGAQSVHRYRRLRVEPAAVGSGVGFRLEVELGSMPRAFFRAVEDTVRETLQQGLSVGRSPTARWR